MTVQDTLILAATRV